MLRLSRRILQNAPKKPPTQDFSHDVRGEEAAKRFHDLHKMDTTVDFNVNLDKHRERIRKNIDEIKSKKSSPKRNPKISGEKPDAFKFKPEIKRNDQYKSMQDSVFPEENLNRITKGYRNLWGTDFGHRMQQALQPVSPLDEKEGYVEGAKWTEIPEMRYWDGRSVKAVNAGRALSLGNEPHFLVVGGGLTGQALTYCLHHWSDKKGAICSDIAEIIDNKKGGWRGDLAQTYGRPSRTPYGRSEIVNFENDPNFTESSTAYALGMQRTAYTNPALVHMAVESKEMLRKLRFHLSILGDDAPDVHFEPVGSLWLARKSEGDVKKTKLLNAYNEARDAQMKYGELGKFTAMLLGPDRLKVMFPWLNTDDVELAVYGLENEGTYNVQALHRYLMHKNRQYGHKYYHGKFVGVKKIMVDDHSFKTFAGQGSHKYVLGGEIKDDVSGIDDDRGPQSKVVSAYFKLPSQEEPIEMMFNRMALCTGQWTKEAALSVGIGDPEAQNEYLRRAMPIEPRKRYNFIINAKQAGPVFDMPYIIDEDAKMTVRRHGLKGDYIVTMWPDPDKGDTEPDHQNLELDHKFWQQRVWPELRHRMPLLREDSVQYKGGWAGNLDVNTYDGAPIVGPHPYHRNIMIMSGFGGLGAHLNMGAAMWLARFIYQGSVDTFGHKEYDWRRQLLPDRIVGYDRTHSEKLHLA